MPTTWSRSCVGDTGSLRLVTTCGGTRLGGGIMSHSGARLSSGLTGWCTSPMTMAGPSAAGESGQRGKRARSPNPTSILANQMRALIESVYGDDAEAPLPDALQGRFFDAEGRAGAERGAATTNVLNLAKGYVRDGGAWDSDVRTPTRLDDDPTVTLRLGRAHGGCIEPYAHSAALGDALNEASPGPSGSRHARDRGGHPPHPPPDHTRERCLIDPYPVLPSRDTALVMR